MKRRLIALFLVLLALAITVGVRISTSPWLERAIRQELEKLAREQLGATMSMGKVDHNLFLTRLSLFDVAFNDISGRGGPPLTVRRIEVAIHPLSPLRGRVAFREIRVEGLSLVVERNAEGGIRVDPLPPLMGKGSGRPERISTRVDSFTLLDASVSFRDPSRGLEGSLDGVLVRVRRRLLDREGRYRVDLGAHGGRLAWADLPGGGQVSLGSLQGGLLYSPGSLEIERLTATAGPVLLSLSGRVPLDKGGLDARVEAGFEAAELPWKSGISGAVRLAGRVTGDLASPVFRGSLSSPGLRSGGMALAEVKGTLALDGKGAALREVSALLDGERIEGQLEAGFGEGFPFRARAQVAGYPLEKLLSRAGAGQAGVVGRVSARGNASGTLEGGEETLVEVAGEGEAAIEASPGRARGFSFKAEGLAGNGSFALTRGSLASGSFALQASGVATTNGPRIAFAFDDPSLDGWEPFIPGRAVPGGELSVSGTLEGRWGSVVGRTDARWSRPGWGALRGDLVQAHADIDRDGVHFPLATLKAGKTSFSLSGWLGWTGAGKASFSVGSGEVEDILAVLGSRLRGSGDLSASFDAANAGDGWTGKGEITGRGISLVGESADLVRLPLLLGKGRLLLDRGLVEKGGRGILVSGTLEGKDFALDVKTRDPFPLEKISVFTTIRAPLRGEVSLQATAQGSLDDPGDAGADGIVSSAALGFDGRPWGGAQATVRIRKKNLAAEGTLFDGRVKAKVSLGLLGDLPFRGELLGEGLTPGDLNDFLQLGLPGTVTGELSANLGAEGFLSDTRTTRVAGTIERARFSISDLGFTVENPVPFSFHPPDGASFSDLVLKTGESVLRGNVRLLSEGGLAGSVKGEIDVAGFPFLAPTVTDFAGKLRLDLVAAGSTNSPRLEGYAELAGVSCIAHLPFALPLHGLSGRLEVLRDRLRFDSVSGEGGGGRVEMSGDLYFKGVSPNRGELAWTAEGVTVPFPQGLTAKGRASISLAFGEGKGVLRGTILADESHYRMPVDLENLLGLLGEAARARPAANEPPPGEGAWLALDLAMETVNPLDADLTILRGKATGALRLQGSSNRPVLSGRLEIAPATIEYRGHVFEVTQGWVGFFNPRVIEPSFDIRGRTLVSGLDADGVYRDFTVDMSVTGTPAKADLAFFSDPPLGKLDVIALLTWGSVTSRLLERAGGVETIGATLLLTTRLRGSIQTGVQRLLGFDRFVINPAKTSASGERDVWVQVDKRLGDRLQLTYATPLGATGDHEVELRYRVTDLFSILGSQKGESEVGLDLDFSFEIP